MNDDRELLELAAKAMGYVVMHHFDEKSAAWVRPLFASYPGFEWSPITDDGDALRLAVKLGIEILPDREVGEVATAFCVRNPALVGLNTMEEFNGDEMAATRRAIVRAAAEIGKSMP